MNSERILPRVLIVDDELIQRKTVERQLAQCGMISESAATAAEALEILQRRDFDVVLLDVQMAEITGLEVLPLIKKIEDAPEVIMLTLDKSLESGITAMRAGAYDYLTKPAATNILEVTIRKATEKHRLIRQNVTLQDFVRGKSVSAEHEIVQASPAMREIVEQAETVAQLGSTVLITGESGTGKDILARMIHRHSRRADSAMVTVNCGAMPENLFESEFFGYEKGAFSGALQTKRGLIEVADDGTLFLDEVGEMPLNLQVKLLRFLESGEFRRVGSTRSLFSDARLIAATNRDLTQGIRENSFRSDLYYRLNVIELHIPPLCERREDIAALIDLYLDVYRSQFGKPSLQFSDEARHRLLNYNYPGNVRELKNIVERAAVLSNGSQIECEQLHFQNPESSTNGKIHDTADLKEFPRFTFDLKKPAENSIIKLDDLERHYIISVLNFTNGNRERAAELLGISERTLYRRLRDYE